MYCSKNKRGIVLVDIYFTQFNYFTLSVQNNAEINN